MFSRALPRYSVILSLQLCQHHRFYSCLHSRTLLSQRLIPVQKLMLIWADLDMVEASLWVSGKREIMSIACEPVSCTGMNCI